MTVGRIVFGSEEARRILDRDKKLLLKRRDWKPEERLFEVTVECDAELVYQVKAKSAKDAAQSYLDGQLIGQDFTNDRLVDVEEV